MGFDTNNHICSTLFKTQERESDISSKEIEQRKESQKIHIKKTRTCDRSNEIQSTALRLSYLAASTTCMHVYITHTHTHTHTYTHTPSPSHILTLTYTYTPTPTLPPTPHPPPYTPQGSNHTDFQCPLALADVTKNSLRLYNPTSR